jgi:protocatechuate 3,4-dioxygenase beta subunit
VILIRRLLKNKILSIFILFLVAAGTFLYVGTKLSYADSPGTISGTFTVNSIPVPGALTYWTNYNSHIVVSATTDANGNYSVGPLQPGVYSPVALYNSVNIPGIPDSMSATPYFGGNVYVNGNVTKNLSFNTDTTQRVIVEDTNGNLVPNATVKMWLPGGSQGLIIYDGDGAGYTLTYEDSSGLTDSNGSVTLPVFSGEYEICAYLQTGVTSPCQTIPSVNPNTPVILTVPSQTPSSPINLEVQTPTNQFPDISWIPGNSTNRPQAYSYNIYRNDVKIGTTNSTSFTDGQAQQGANSYYITAESSNGLESNPSNTIIVIYDTTPPVVTITGVTNGETYASNNIPTPVCSTTDTLSGVATNATLSMTNVGDSYTATCSGATDNAGNSAQNVSATYTLLPSNYILVNLSNSTGSYLSGAKVTIENSSSQITTLSTDSFGNTYLNTTPGTYKVTVYYANGYESQFITVTANGPNNVNFTTVLVTVTINDPNTTDLINAKVAQAGNTGEFGSKQPVNSNGQITFQVLPGTSYFTAYVANGYQEQSITATTTGPNTITYNTYSVLVTVTKNGIPLPTATVDQAGNSGDYGSRQNVNSNGQYTFYVLPGTNYFEAFDGPNNYAKQTLDITADTSISIAVN